MGGLEQGPLPALVRGHAATAAQLGVLEAIAVVRGAHEKVDLEGPVLAVLEGVEAIEDESLVGGPSGSEPLVEEQTVAAEPLGLALDGGVGDTELEGDLAKRGAAVSDPEEDGALQLGALQPVGGGEGL